MLTRRERKWCRTYARAYDAKQASAVSGCPESLAYRADVLMFVGDLINQKLKYTEFKPTIADEVLHRLEGGESLSEITIDPGMPNRSTIYDWVKQDPQGFGVKYVQARDYGYQVRAERIPYEARTAGDAQKGRLVMDADKWYLAKMKPHLYGEKVEVEHGGSVSGTLAVVALTTTDPQEAAREYQKLLSGAK